MANVYSRIMLSFAVLAIFLTLPVMAQNYAQSQNMSQSVTINITASDLAFNTSTITVPAGANVVVNFNNMDTGIDHNFAVYTDSSASTTIFKGEVITGPMATTYTFTAPTTPGTYFFRCDIHPAQMTGRFIAK
ncbi:MAG TPA: cupredoxin domain-containing protein [Methanotrichaceae archaeon]|nr:cupredoxin domain-containing protein [Methanotrichaceae archaeon]